MGKYAPLRSFLLGQRADAVPMTFAEIERVIATKLPNSQNYPAWWSNNPLNNVMTREWLAAGFKTEQVDIDGRRLVFRRYRSLRPAAIANPASTRKDGPVRHPIVGALKDVTSIAPSLDLTEPIDPEWADLVEHPDWGKLPK